MDYRLITLSKENILIFFKDIQIILESDELKKWTKEQILYELPRKFEVSVGLIFQGNLFGFIFGSEKENHVFHIHKMMVSNQLQGQKMGAQLINFFHKKVTEFNGKAVSLWVYDINKGAIRFYKCHNYQLTDENRIKDDYLIHKMIKKII